RVGGRRRARARRARRTARIRDRRSACNGPARAPVDRAHRKRQPPRRGPRRRDSGRLRNVERAARIARRRRASGDARLGPRLRPGTLAARRMTRFNYAPSRFAALGAFRLSMGRPAVRGPLLALAASAVLVAATSAIQMMRLQTLEREASAIGAQRTVLEPALTRLRAAQRTVARLEAQAEARAAVLSSGTLRANEVASIGNALPRDAWLTALRVTPRTIALE